MQVNRIQSNNYNNHPNFGSLKITEEATKIMRKTFTPEQMNQVRKWGKELENTKHFDLEIKLTKKFNELSYIFRHKTNPELSSEGPLHPIGILHKKLHARAYSLYDYEERFTYNNLQFPKAQELGEAYAKLASHQEACLSPQNHYFLPNDFKTLKWVVDSTKILDKAAQHTGDEIRLMNVKSQTVETVKPTKQSFWKRLFS